MLFRLRPALAGLLVLGLAGASFAGETRVKAPNFRAQDLDGDPVVLEELLGKGPILVDFWATWCKPCLKELPYVQRLHDELGERGLKVLAVTIDSPKSQSRVRPFIRSKKYDFTVVMDAGQDVFRKLQGKSTVPYVVVLDSEGFIRYRHTGYKPGDEKELERVVLELLEEGGDAGAPEEPAQAAG
jgi:peroxiredoxin